MLSNYKEDIFEQTDNEWIISVIMKLPLCVIRELLALECWVGAALLGEGDITSQGSVARRHGRLERLKGDQYGHYQILLFKKPL